MTVSYEALDANSEYVINFPAGALTDAGGEKSFVGEVKLTTGDFPRAKQSGETHWGKAIKTLPVNFAPFNTVAPFETVGGLVQTSQNDYPHWCYTAGGSNAGEVTADHVTFRSASSNDKVMAYFDGTAKKIYLEVSASEGSACRLKIQGDPQRRHRTHPAHNPRPLPGTNFPSRANSNSTPNRAS